jgi:hypothetical protein
MRRTKRIAIGVGGGIALLALLQCSSGSQSNVASLVGSDNSGPATTDPSPSTPFGGNDSTGGGTIAGGPGGFVALAPNPPSVTSASRARPDAGPYLVPAGELTAGAWDDVVNPDVFASFASTFEQQSSAPDTGGAGRVVITVQGDQAAPLSNATVTVFDANTTYLTAPTASDGRVLFVPSRDLGANPEAGAPDANTTPLRVKVELPNAAPFTTDAPSGNAWAITVPGANAPAPQALDLAFVVDTTGSMADELAYLQNEIDGVVAQVHAAYPQVDVRLGLVVYRDTVDIYLTRTFDFTTSLPTFDQNLRAQSAAGGGDYPESMEKGLHAMNALSWRTGNVARVAFLVADAPPHPADVGTAFDEVNAARLRGVRLYSIAGSGAMEDAEFVLRSSAQLTGARYLFLTDDSGIGDPHEVPHIPCYVVEYLRPLVERAIGSELTGMHLGPNDADILRTTGSPTNGVCTIQDASVATLF